MALLTEIIDAASGDAMSVSTLLRKMKVLAARTGTGRLAEWVDHELAGYPDETSAPSYRGPFSPPVLGHFVGPLNIEAENVPIAPVTFPEDAREGPLFKMWLLAGLAEIEQMAAQEVMRFTWPSDALRYYNWGIGSGEIKPTVQEGMALVGAVRPLPRQVFVGVVDAVRNRVLDLALELEAAAPHAGEPSAPEEVREAAQKVINNFNFAPNSFASNSNFAIGSSHVTQTVEMPQARDEPGLIRYLAAAGIDPLSLIRLQEALAEDRAEAGGTEPTQPGSRVLAWIRSTTAAIGTEVGTGVVSAAITAYFGG